MVFSSGWPPSRGEESSIAEEQRADVGWQDKHFNHLGESAVFKKLSCGLISIIFNKL